MKVAILFFCLLLTAQLAMAQQGGYAGGGQGGGIPGGGPGGIPGGQGGGIPGGGPGGYPGGTPGGGQGGYQGGVNTGSGFTDTKGEFPHCPFEMDMSELIPANVASNLQTLAQTLSDQKNSPNCRQTGQDLVNLYNLISPKKKKDEGGGGPGGFGNGPGGDSESCKTNPAKCDALITTLLQSAQQDVSCYDGVANGVETLIGAALQVGTMLAVPGVGQVALGISAVKGLITLFKKRKADPRNQIDQFFKKGLLEAKMNTLTACYGDKLYQDTYCRETYLECFLGTADDVSSQGLCADGMKMDLLEQPVSGASAGYVIRSRGRPDWDPCKAYKERDMDIDLMPGEDGKSVDHLVVLRQCLKKNPAHKDFTDDQFKIETHVMSDIYACVSYWMNIQKKDTGKIDPKELSRIKRGCFKDKTTKGGAPIDAFTFIFNKSLYDGNNKANQTAKRELLPDVLRVAQDYHQKQMNNASYSDRAGILDVVNTCYHGYGGALAFDSKLDNGKTFYSTQEKNSLPEQCQTVSDCALKGLKATSQKPKLPSEGSSFYNIKPVQALDSMFLYPEKTQDINKLFKRRTKYVSDVSRVCYGMAMNQVISHSTIADNLVTMKFDGKSCNGDAKKKKIDFGDADEASQE